MHTQYCRRDVYLLDLRQPRTVHTFGLVWRTLPEAWAWLPTLGVCSIEKNGVHAARYRGSAETTRACHAQKARSTAWTDAELFQTGPSPWVVNFKQGHCSCCAALCWSECGTSSFTPDPSLVPFGVCSFAPVSVPGLAFSRRRPMESGLCCAWSPKGAHRE